MAEMTAAQPAGPSSFFEWVGTKHIPPPKSLDALDGNVIHDKPTPMIARVADARATPIPRLSCDQVRLLVSQREGLRWLAAPVAIFVRTYPGACATFYAGDLSLAALRAFDELLIAAPKLAREMIEADFSQIEPCLRDKDPRFSEEVESAIASAKALARGN